MSRFDQHSDERSGRLGRTTAVAAAFVLAVAVVAGCGDDDDAVDTTETEAVETDGTEATEDTAATDDTTATDETEASGEEDVTVDIVSVSEGFEPSTATVAAGGEITWVNTDGLGHTTTADDGTWDSGTLATGEEFTFIVEEPGTYTYVCTIHPNMEGELVVE